LSQLKDDMATFEEEK